MKFILTRFFALVVLFLQASTVFGTNQAATNRSGSNPLLGSRKTGFGLEITPGNSSAYGDITRTSVLLAVTCTLISNESYPGSNDGSADVSVSGGLPPYSGDGLQNGLAAGTYTFTVTDSNGDSGSCTITIGSNCISSTPANSISASATTICKGNSVTLTVSGGVLGTQAFWAWSEDSCQNGTTLGTGSTIQHTPLTIGLHTYFVRAIGPCGMTSCVSITIQVNPLVNLGVIAVPTYPVSACLGGTATIICSNIAGATNYFWTGPAGVLFNGSPSPYISTVNSVTLSFIALPAPGVATWVISVYGYNNTCGKTSNTRSIGIKAQPGTPAAITGNAISCPATTAPYSIPALDGAVNYTWSITGNASINSIGTPVVTTVPTISIDFGVGFTSGQLCVYGTNACGYQSPQRCKNIGTAPALPGAISGSATICSGVSSNYSILPVAGTNAYTWSVTGTGISISASGTAATVSTLPSFTNGSICVFAQGVCPAPAGTSPMRCKTLGTGKLSTPGNITGDPAFGVCDGTSIYSVNSLAGATAGYTWTLPSGASGSSNSNSIFIQFSDTFSIGQLCVHGNNVCGAGFDRCLTLYGGPAAPGSIAGNSTPCVGADEVFTWPAASGATHYQLFAPANVTFLTPNPTIDNYAVVNWNRIQAGTLSVVAANDCGESGSRGLTINPVACKMAPNSEIETAPSGSVFPDPSNGKFTLQFDNPKQDFTEYSLFVSEPGGRIILHTNGYCKPGINIQEFDLTGYNKGIYFLRLSFAQFVQHFSVVIY